MAKLSNINGKFAVEDTGAIRFSDQTGTTGQILKSNGNAAPTWVDGSTVIGGPYLPLAGGILTGATSTASGISFTVGGALTGTTATFTGDLTVNSTLKWATTNSTSYTYSNADSQGLYIETAGSTAALSDMRFQARSAGSGNYSYIKIKPSDQSILLGTNAADRLTINSSGNAIFAGTVTSSAFLMSNGSFTQNGFWGTTINAGSGSLADFALLNSATAGIMYNPTGTLNMVFQGNVGIGETSPSNKLQIGQGHSILVGDYFQLGSGSSDIMGALGWNRDTTNGVIYNTNFGAFQMHNNQSVLCLQGYNSSGTNQFEHLFFNNGNTFFDGNVGIGTTTPDYQLDVENSSHAIVRIHAGVNSSASLRLKNDAQDWDLNTQTNDTFAIYNQTSATQPFSILPNGNIGIGTTTPITKLSVHNSTETTGITDVLTVTCATTNSASVGKGAAIRIGRDPDGNYSTKIATVYEQNNPSFLNPAMVFYTMYNSYLKGSEVQRMRITSDGDVIIGTETSTACTLKVSSTKNGSESSPHFCLTGNGYSALHWLDTVAYHILTNSVGREIRIVANTGGVKLTVNATAWVSNSDIALKENLKPLENVLDKIKDYRCVEYNLKESPEDKKIGFIAQDWVDDFPAIVDKDEKDMLGMKYTETIPVLLKAIQELKAEVEELKKQIN